MSLKLIRIIQKKYFNVERCTVVAQNMARLEPSIVISNEIKARRLEALSNLSQARKSEALKSTPHFCQRMESSGFFVFELYIFRNLAVNFTFNLACV